MQLLPFLQHFATFGTKYNISQLFIVNAVLGIFPVFEQPFTSVSLAVLTVSEDVTSVKTYLEKRLQNNSGLQDIFGLTRKDNAPSVYASLQQCTATSVSVERNFSILKKVLGKDRNFCDDNVEKYLIKLYNSSA